MKPLEKIPSKSHRRNFNGETREKLLAKGAMAYSGNEGRNEKIVWGFHWGWGGGQYGERGKKGG